MSRKNNGSGPSGKRHTGLNIVLILLILLLIAGSAMMIYLCMGIADRYMDQPLDQVQR